MSVVIYVVRRNQSTIHTAVSRTKREVEEEDEGKLTILRQLGVEEGEEIEEQEKTVLRQLGVEEEEEEEGE